MLPLDVPIYVALGRVDLRWSFDRLIAIVRDTFGQDPRGGLALFVNRRADRAKLLFHDGSGWCLLYKRLERGVFPLPESVDPRVASVCISSRELALILQGRDLPARGRRRKTKPVLH